MIKEYTNEILGEETSSGNNAELFAYMRQLQLYEEQEAKKRKKKKKKKKLKKKWEKEWKKKEKKKRKSTRTAGATKGLPETSRNCKFARAHCIWQGNYKKY